MIYLINCSYLNNGSSLPNICVFLCMVPRNNLLKHEAKKDDHVFHKNTNWQYWHLCQLCIPNFTFPSFFTHSVPMGTGELHLKFANFIGLLNF